MKQQVMYPFWICRLHRYVYMTRQIVMDLAAALSHAPKLFAKLFRLVFSPLNRGWWPVYLLFIQQYVITADLISIFGFIFCRYLKKTSMVSLMHSKSAKRRSVRSLLPCCCFFFVFVFCAVFQDKLNLKRCHEGRKTLNWRWIWESPECFFVFFYSHMVSLFSSKVICNLPANLV